VDICFSVAWARLEAASGHGDPPPGPPAPFSRATEVLLPTVAADSAASRTTSRTAAITPAPGPPAGSQQQCAVPQADNTLLNPEVHLYINVYFRRVLQILRWLPPGLRTRCTYD
jgi:hypothetical protein